MSDFLDVPDYDKPETMVMPVSPLEGVSDFKSLGEPVNAPGDKNEDELAQLPASIAEQIPEAAFAHPAVMPDAPTGPEPSNEDFPAVIVQRRKFDKRLLDPHD